ncbi:hypothetical protein MMC07_003060 [Pseudocyphellaria aurata]|nr:hypothetical protein [Pseudocyphellaria aurata]
MLTPILRRVLLQSPSQSIVLLPTFLLPWRAQLSTVTHTTSLHPPPTTFQPQKTSPAAPSPPTTFQPQKTSPAAPSSPTIPSPPPPQTSTEHQPPDSSLSEPSPNAPALQPPPLLKSLAVQPPHYIIAHLHGRPYLLTAGDKLRLPFHLANAPIGTMLRFNRASALGSRDYTFRGSPWVDERFFVCRMRVLGVEGEPMRIKEKTKRRNRRVKRVKTKMRFTILRCVELKVLGGGVGEVESQMGEVEGQMGEVEGKMGEVQGQIREVKGAGMEEGKVQIEK